MELLKIEDIMQLLGVGRDAATAIVNLPGCPCLPRKKGGTYRIPKDAFLAWIRSGDYE